MEQLQSPDAARQIAAFRERLKVFRDRGFSSAHRGPAAASQVQPRDEADTAWSDTQWTDTVFDSRDC